MENSYDRKLYPAVKKYPIRKKVTLPMRDGVLKTWKVLRMVREYMNKTDLGYVRDVLGKANELIRKELPLYLLSNTVRQFRTHGLQEFISRIIDNVTEFNGFKVGDSVTFISGQYDPQEGTICYFKKNGTARIFTEMKEWAWSKAGKYYRDLEETLRASSDDEIEVI